MTNFMQYNLISHFMSLQPMFSFRSTIFLFTNDTDFHYFSWQLFFVFRKFHMFRALGHLSNVIHSSSNCVFFLPSHKTFEVKFPLWLKDKVEFLACLNMLTVSPLMKDITSKNILCFIFDVIFVLIKFCFWQNNE